MKRFTILGILIIFVALLAIGGCVGGVTPPTTPTPTPAPSTGSVHGIVQEKGTGTPLSGVSITVDGGSAITSGSDGSYRVTGLTPGYHTLVFTKEGYKTRTESIEIVAGQDKEYKVEMENTTATIQIEISQDAYISESGSNGTSPTIAIGAYVSGADTRMLFQFTHTSIPADAKVISAKLKLYKRLTLPISGYPIPYAVYPIINSEDWDESVVTWLWRKTGFPWFTPGGSFDDTYEISTGSFPLGSILQWEEVDVAKAFEYWKTHDNNGIMVKTTQSTSAYVAFYSKEYKVDTQLQPYVEVTYYIP